MILSRSPAAMRCVRKPASPRRSRRPSGLGRGRGCGLIRTETFAVTAIAYLQAVTRGEISRLAGCEISRDVIATPPKRYDLDWLAAFH
jgi:hypothetical protein